MTTPPTNLSNKISALLAARTQASTKLFSAPHNPNPEGSNFSSLSTSTATKTTSTRKRLQDEEDLSSLDPTAGIGYRGADSGPGPGPGPGAKDGRGVDAGLRNKLLGKRGWEAGGNGRRGRVGNGNGGKGAGTLVRGESSDEGEGRSSLGRRKKVRRVQGGEVDVKANMSMNGDGNGETKEGDIVENAVAANEESESVRDKVVEEAEEGRQEAKGPEEEEEWNGIASSPVEPPNDVAPPDPTQKKRKNKKKKKKKKAKKPA